MTVISNAVSAEIQSMAQSGISPKAIAEAVGMKTMTVYQHLRRRGRLAAPLNQLERVARMVPFNGGCSTLSGMREVTLPRLGCLGEKDFRA